MKIIGAIVKFKDFPYFVTMNFMNCRPEMDNEDIVSCIYGEYARFEDQQYFQTDWVKLIWN